ncbi:MAG: M48 family metalloprotease [Betaproteobacteria bacterium]|nr:M48 family metalloprotease [Betaproteobacteria bacterium]
MDFFKAQEQAQKKTRWLVFWFVLAVVGIMVWACLGYSLLLFLYALLGDRTWGIWIIFSYFIFWLLAVFKILGDPRIHEAEKIITGNEISHRRILAAISQAFVIFVIFLILWAFMKRMPDGVLDNFWDYWIYWIICAFVVATVAVASLYKRIQTFRNGGRLIAEQLGGHMIMRDTSNPAERCLLNVIDEISIAAGIPAPVVFVLDNEPGLNAFAAGLSTHDSVIGVTRGLLQAMNRDELQGVIAHEISHIVNGDARLNLNMISYLYGIYSLTFIGRALIYKGVQLTHLGIFLTPLGLLFCFTGYIALFFGRLIQATVSREREYLADASAVQFTRYSAGLASALRKLQVSGSQIKHQEAIAARHLFLGASDMPDAFETFFTNNLGLSLFATHPPLADRIRRLRAFPLHQPDGEKILPPLPAVPFEEEHHLPILTANPHAVMPVLQSPQVQQQAANLPEEISPESLSQAQNLLTSLPDTLREQTHSFIGATGILVGLLFARQPDIRARQEKLLPSGALPTAQELYQWLAEQPEHGAHYRLVWLDLILPTLREALESERKELLALPALRDALVNERQQLLVLAKNLIRADGRVSPTEFALYSLLRGALLSPSERQVKRHELRLEQLDKDISDLLALLAYSGHEDVKAAEAAYQAAIASSPASKKHPLPAKNELSLNKISEALSHLALAAPPYRKKLLEACTIAVQHDGKITPVENELLRAFAQSLDCPAPPTTRLTFA